MLGVAFFGLGAIVLAWQMIARKPALVLNTDGLEWQITIGTMGRVGWSQVTGVEVYDQHVDVPNLHASSRKRFQWVRVFVQDPDAVTSQASGRAQRVLRGANRMATPATPVWINCQTVPLAADAIASLVDGYARSYHMLHQVSGPGPLQ